MNEREAAQLRLMPTREIERCRDIVQLQIPIAFKHENLVGLAHLQQWEMHYIDELVRRDEGA